MNLFQSNKALFSFVPNLPSLLITSAINEEGKRLEEVMDIAVDYTSDMGGECILNVIAQLKSVGWSVDSLAAHSIIACITREIIVSSKRSRANNMNSAYNLGVSSNYVYACLDSK